MSETPNLLKQKNLYSSSRFLTGNSSSSKIKGSHLASHHNLSNHTPVNSRTKLNPGSSKIDSSKKKKIPSFSKIATLNSANVVTPTSSKLQTNSTTKTDSSTKGSFGINPICNGIDYTNIMQKKSQYGYTGPGYIVEFDFDPQHLRGIRVEKGLWKVNKWTTNKNTEAILGIGMNYTRIDEPDRSTPLKQLTNYDFTYNPKTEFSGNLRKNLMSKFSNDDMNLEPKTAKPKKCFRWAENLEIIEEKTQNVDPNLEEQKEVINGSPKLVKKLRKSMSMSDLNKLIADIDRNNETLEEVEPYKTIDFEPNKENLNSTYDKVEPKMNTPFSQVIHYAVHLSPAKVTNSSFLDPVVSTNMLQPNLNFPSISPVKDLSITQTLSTTDSIKEIKSIENENQDWEKKLDEFVNVFKEIFKEIFGEKNVDQDESDQIFLKQEFKNSITDLNRSNMMFKFEKMEKMIHQFKFDLFTKPHNSAN